MLRARLDLHVRRSFPSVKNDGRVAKYAELAHISRIAIGNTKDLVSAAVACARPSVTARAYVARFWTTSARKCVLPACPSELVGRQLLAVTQRPRMREQNAAAGLGGDRRVVMGRTVRR